MGRRSAISRVGQETAFTRLLRETTSWPSDYCFKFIVPAAQLDALCRRLPEQPTATRASRNGGYQSVTLRIEMASPEAVLAVYASAAKVPGVIAL